MSTIVWGCMLVRLLLADAYNSTYIGAPRDGTPRDANDAATDT